MRRVQIRVRVVTLVLSFIGLSLSTPPTSMAALTDAQRCAMGVEKEITNLQKCLGKVNLNIAKGRNVTLPADDETCLAKFERGWERNRARYQATPAPACQAGITTDAKRRVLAVNLLAAGRDLSLYPPLQGMDLLGSGLALESDLQACRATEISFTDDCDRVCSGPIAGPFECARIRKEVSALSTNELLRLNSALVTAYTDPSSGMQALTTGYQTIASYQIMSTGSFLPWHRGYLLAAENILRQQDCRITIPYWDWTDSAQVADWHHWGNAPQQFSGNGNSANSDCVEDGPFGENNGFVDSRGRCIRRDFGSNPLASRQQIENDLLPIPASNYASFRNRLQHGPGLHDSMHCTIGGTMCSSRAADDPIFLLTHTTIDRIWDQWQKQSPAHQNAYEGRYGRNDGMPVVDWNPDQLLDLEDQPGGVIVRYE